MDEHIKIIEEIYKSRGKKYRNYQKIEKIVYKLASEKGEEEACHLLDSVYSDLVEAGEDREASMFEFGCRTSFYYKPSII